MMVKRLNQSFLGKTLHQTMIIKPGILTLILPAFILAGCMETRPQKNETTSVNAKEAKPRTRLVPPLVVVKTTAGKSRPAPIQRENRVVEFTDQDRRIILQYYRNRTPGPYTTQHSRASNAQWKQFRKSGQWSNKLKEKNLPYALESRLGPLPTGYTRKQIGHHLLIRNLNTDEIVDFIMDIAY